MKKNLVPIESTQMPSVSKKLATHTLANWELGQRFQSAVGSVKEEAGAVGDKLGQAVTQIVKCAKSPLDFARFPDKSKEVQHNFTLSEVQKCDGVGDHCLYIIYDKDMVLDLTEFANYHCGGRQVLVDCAGTDATEKVFRSGMPLGVFRRFLRIFQVGTLVREPNSTSPVVEHHHCGWWELLKGSC